MPDKKKQSINAAFEEALAGVRHVPWWRTQLPPLLESRFSIESASARRRQFLFWATVNVVISALVLGLDAMTIPDVWHLAVLLRLGVVVPVGLFALYQLRQERRRWIEELAAVGPSHLNALAALLLFGLSEPFDVVKAFTLISTIVVMGNVLFPIRVKQAVIFSISTMLIGNATNFFFMARHGIDTDITALLIFSHAAVCISLVARGVAERETRFSFVRGLALQIRVDSLAHSNERLLALASTDALTSLANRRHFDQALGEAWREALQANTGIAVLLIDVDYFKLFNDTAGHLEGDRCLATVARIIAEQVRQEQDLAARFGGEEFVVLMPITALDTAEIIAERIRKTIGEKKIPHPGRREQGAFLSVSIGVSALAPARMEAASPAVLLAAADACLYRAKSAGRNRVVGADCALAAHSDTP